MNLVPQLVYLAKEETILKGYNIPEGFIEKVALLITQEEYERLISNSLYKLISDLIKKHTKETALLGLLELTDLETSNKFVIELVDILTRAFEDSKLYNNIHQLIYYMLLTRMEFKKNDKNENH